MSAEQTTISLDPSQLEGLIRRVVREELGRALAAQTRTVVGDWSQEGPEDPEGDRALLADAVSVLEQHADEPEAWVTLEGFERGIDEAGARGQLPR